MKNIACNTKLGFTNLFAHLRSCYAQGQSIAELDKLIRKLYDEALESSHQHGGAILSHFQVHVLSELDRAVYRYARFIVLQSLPISIVLCQELRDVFRFGPHICRQKLTEILFSLCELVEKRIAEKIKGTSGALMYDGWSDTGIHYVGYMPCTQQLLKPAMEAAFDLFRRYAVLCIWCQQ